MKLIVDFVSKFRGSLRLDENLIIKKEKRYFLINQGLRQQTQRDFFYAGAYLGKVKDGVFFPSFILLSMIAKGKANKVMVNDRTAWLFICGRDVFKRGILNVWGSKRKGDYSLVLNQHGECLGFGKISRNMNEKEDKNKAVVKNISDIGDFLRRER